MKAPVRNLAVLVVSLLVSAVVMAGCGSKGDNNQPVKDLAPKEVVNQFVSAIQKSDWNVASGFISPSNTLKSADSLANATRPVRTAKGQITAFTITNEIDGGVSYQVYLSVQYSSTNQFEEVRMPIELRRTDGKWVISSFQTF